MSRDPKAEEIDAIRQLVAQSGSVADLHRWIKIACPTRRGRPSGSKLEERDRSLLAAAERAYQLNQGKISLNKLIQINVALSWDRTWGASRPATVKRLLERKRAERKALRINRT